MKQRMNWTKTSWMLALLFMAAILCVPLLAWAEEADETQSLELHFDYHLDLSGGMSGEAMAKGYVNQIMYPDRASRNVRNMGERLTGNEANMYKKLSKIIPDIAAGRRSSTIFEAPLTEIVANRVITASGLGVSYLRDENGVLTQTTLNAIEERLKVDLDNLFYALEQDFPYELYWLDRTNGARIIYIYSDVKLEHTRTRLEITSGTYTIGMAVSTEFTDNGDRTKVNTAWGQRAEAAAKNAKDIVNKNKNLSDIDKLYAYKNAICDLVDYNLNAGNDYGNPWQLIWVFDGDPSTNVVCEGYSKAFKYLCDLSTFKGNITAGIAYGAVMPLYHTIFGITDIGNHMWNIVAMNDGKNYLADITMCDSGQMGSPDYLFLKGYYKGYDEGVYWYATPYDYIGYAYKSSISNLYYEGELVMSGTDYASTPMPASSPTPQSTPTPVPNLGTASLTASASSMNSDGVFTVTLGIQDNPGVAFIGIDSNAAAKGVSIENAQATGIAKDWAVTLGNKIVIYSTQDTKENGAFLVLTMKSASKQETELTFTVSECYNSREQNVKVSDASVVIKKGAVPGDCNGDGIVDGRDLLRLARYVAGTGVQIDISAADVNGDGHVDGRDVLRLAKQLAN